ncbi:DUF2484 family protein [Defluviimonas sp. WL0024]|uniref:DUF2484 family protein n=1 Tax=Albidovulum salinarum TaxID=2984153 RepID=A0ABT2X6P8_9RHOB|nr:DUF2484 family protein [Defluviimonas sp. WL0024]MCU9849628.1 DUF2484 family protein [Defluviimonas sp. WL0024]
MNTSLLLAALWAIVATVVALIPSRDRHWRAAYVLITVGIPIVGWVTYQNGPWVGLIVLGAGTSILRWPLIHLWRWLRRKTVN